MSRVQIVIVCPAHQSEVNRNPCLKVNPVKPENEKAYLMQRLLQFLQLGAQMLLLLLQFHFRPIKLLQLIPNSFRFRRQFLRCGTKKNQRRVRAVTEQSDIRHKLSVMYCKFFPWLLFQPRARRIWLSPLPTVSCTLPVRHRFSGGLAPDRAWIHRNLTILSSRLAVSRFRCMTWIWYNAFFRRVRLFSVRMNSSASFFFAYIFTHS